MRIIIAVTMLLAVNVLAGEINTIVVDLSKMKGSDVVIKPEPLTNLVLYSVNGFITTTNIYAESVTDTVKRLAKSGEICKVFGHCWIDGRVGEGAGVTFLDYHPNTLYRHCKICGKQESSSIGIWK